jgi:hypothetical protein
MDSFIEPVGQRMTKATELVNVVATLPKVVEMNLLPGDIVFQVLCGRGGCAWQGRVLNVYSRPSERR